MNLIGNPSKNRRTITKYILPHPNEMQISQKIVTIPRPKPILFNKSHFRKQLMKRLFQRKSDAELNESATNNRYSLLSSSMPRYPKKLCQYFSEHKDVKAKNNPRLEVTISQFKNPVDANNETSTNMSHLGFKSSFNGCMVPPRNLVERLHALMFIQKANKSSTAKHSSYAKQLFCRYQVSNIPSLMLDDVGLSHRRYPLEPKSSCSNHRRKNYLIIANPGSRIQSSNGKPNNNVQNHLPDKSSLLAASKKYSSLKCVTQSTQTKKDLFFEMAELNGW